MKGVEAIDITIDMTIGMAGEWINWLTWLLLLLGCFFFFVGTVGLFRMPDFFSRVHVAGLIDTIAPLFILAALLLRFGWSFKLLAIAVLLLFVNPATTYALCRTARYHLGRNKNG